MSFLFTGLCTSKVAKEINHPSVEENVGKSHKNSVCISEGKSSHRSFSRDSIIAETSSVASTKNEKKLLSSIQALKNELTAKNDLIDQKEADKANCEGVISSMKEEFTCVICNELFINAHSLICSHLFCEFCIKKWMSSEHMECPICRVRITTQPACSSVLNNAVSKLEVKLRAEELQERTKMKEEHKARLLEISKVSFPSAISEAYNSEYSISSESESDDYDSERDSYDSEYDDFSSFDSMDQTEDYNSVSSSDLHDISFPDIGSDVHDSSDSSFTSSDSHESEDTSFGGCSQASALSEPSDASSTTGYGCVSSHRLLSDDTETETEMENVYNHSRDSISRNFSVVNPDLMHCHSNFHDDLEQESSDSRYFSCSEGESGCTR